jgi:probable phosphoglycerate mutase
MELILVRHGLPVRQELDTGRADPGLSTIGHRQAELVARWLEPIRIDAVYSSPMIRARQTAGPYEQLSGRSAVVHEGVAEFGREARSYVPTEELKVDDYEAWRALADRGGISEVELNTFSSAVVRAMKEIIASHKSETALVFCHGGVINVWACHVLGLPSRMFFEPIYTSVNRFLCASSGERNIASLNEAAHLRDL